MKSSDFRDSHIPFLSLEGFHMNMVIKDLRIRRWLKRTFTCFTLLGMPFSVFWILRYAVKHHESLSYFQIWAMMMVCIACFSGVMVYLTMFFDGEFDSGYR